MVSLGTFKKWFVGGKKEKKIGLFYSNFRLISNNQACKSLLQELCLPYMNSVIPRIAESQSVVFFSPSKGRNIHQSANLEDGKRIGPKIK